MKRIIAVFLLSAASAHAAPGGAPITLGWSGPLSGNCAVVGVDTVPALQALVERTNAEGGVNGRPIALVAEDDGYDVVRAVSAYKKLTGVDGASVVFASTYGGIFATAKDAAADGALVIDTLDCNEEIAALQENTLCLATQTESISDGFAEDIVRKGYRSVAILVEESDGWMQLIARNTRRALDAAGVRVVEQSTLQAAADYRPPLLRAKAARAEAMILLGNDQMGLAMRQARELGLSLKYYGVGSVLSPGFQKLAGGEIEGALVSSWLAPRDRRPLRELLDSFQAAHGRAPYLELAVVPAHDALAMVIECLKSTVGPGDEPDAGRIRRCLLAMKSYPGASGDITFDSDGAVRSIRERLFRIEGGKLVEP